MDDPENKSDPLGADPPGNAPPSDDRTAKLAAAKEMAAKVLAAKACAKQVAADSPSETEQPAAADAAPAPQDAPVDKTAAALAAARAAAAAKKANAALPATPSGATQDEIEPAAPPAPKAPVDKTAAAIAAARAAAAAKKANAPKPDVPSGATQNDVTPAAPPAPKPPVDKTAAAIAAAKAAAAARAAAKSAPAADAAANRDAAEPVAPVLAKEQPTQVPPAKPAAAKAPTENAPATKEKPVVNPEAELTPRSRDIELTPEQLAALSVFKSLKKVPSFSKFPGSWLLRYFRQGEAICRQGDAGGTAYYLLTAADLDELAKLVDGAGEPPAGESLRRVSSRIAATAADSSGARRLATARLLIDTPRRPSVQRSWWPFGRSRATPAITAANPALIANDGPTDIDYATKQAAIYEGELFGEMSCLTRQPRSATIVADTECFALEILRNILEQMRKDPGYKEATQKKYRQRVLEGHLRQLSIFGLLTDAQFTAVAERVELVDYEPGTVIWDEGDASDSLLIVRTGIVQVVQSYPWQLTVGIVTSWPKLLDTLRSRHESDAAVGRLWKALPQAVKDAIAGAADSPAESVQQQVVDALNDVAKTDALVTAKEMSAATANSIYARETAGFAAKPKDWTGLELRRANRVLWHVLLPDAVAPAEPIGLARVLRYVGRGSTLGETGVLLDRARSATCVAYSHPDADREATNVELVRVPGEVVRQMAADSPAVRAEMNRIATAYTAHDAAPPTATSELSQSRRAEELGLMQGQKLMLIDLDRCTRCGDCVEACIATHDDGHSRLYLDGPRFGKFLVPSACRQCRDPVCMIGCPVGSIQQGVAGEVVIRDWCIGCGLCADQCPYDSIQMHDAAIVRSDAPAWYWQIDGAVGDTDWRRPSFRETSWHVGANPLRWGIAMQQSVFGGNSNAAGARAVCFRHRFRVDAADYSPADTYRLEITSQGAGLEVHLNGHRLEPTPAPPPKKKTDVPKPRTEYEYVIPGSALVRGENVLAVESRLPAPFNATLLDARLDRLAPESEHVAEKLVTERAVVCDQCASLPGNRAACVYACPHEAAMRVDVWLAMPEA